MSFEQALAATLDFEDGIPGPAGDIANDRRDRGGKTKWGVTQRAYDSWRARHKLPLRDVESMEDGEMRALYREDYWEPCAGDVLPPLLAHAVFDMAVHSGVTEAKRALQRSLRVEVDGVIGPKTLAAALERGSVLAFLKQRGGYYQDVIRAHPGDVEFLENWINRLLDQAWRARP